ncbi:MAG: hypothetical protein MJ053_07655 [Elusimicrobiaceae bacterium]|nr:hypothetical protein [Elusimicrobiaceae bacterium]
MSITLRKKIPPLCLVTDKDGVLKGVIRPAELAFYEGPSVVGSVMTQLPALLAQDTLSRARELFAQTQADALAVVNEQQICVGVLNRLSLPAKSEKKSFWQDLLRR